MAALPANNTDRLFLHYQNAINSHTAMIRIAPGADIATVMDAFESILSTLTGAFVASAGTNADFQAAGDDFSVPVSAGDWDTFTWGSGAAVITSDGVQFNFQGRSSGGHKSRLGVFGYKNDVSNWRLTEVEAAGVGTAVAVLQDTTGAFLAIDGLKPTWYGYANIKYNDYWVRQGRS